MTPWFWTVHSVLSPICGTLCWPLQDTGTAPLGPVPLQGLPQPPQLEGVATARTSPTAQTHHRSQGCSLQGHTSRRRRAHGLLGHDLYILHHPRPTQQVRAQWGDQRPCGCRSNPQHRPGVCPCHSCVKPGRLHAHLCGPALEHRAQPPTPTYLWKEALSRDWAPPPSGTRFLAYESNI